jgi:hypothetical protein
MALFPLLFSLARSFFAPRLELMAEILALRQQLAILNRTANRPSLRFQDRLFSVTLAECWQDWRSALLIVKPETVITPSAKEFADMLWIRTLLRRSGKRVRNWLENPFRDSGRMAPLRWTGWDLV